MNAKEGLELSMCRNGHRTTMEASSVDEDAPVCAECGLGMQHVGTMRLL